MMMHQLYYLTAALLVTGGVWGGTTQARISGGSEVAPPRRYPWVVHITKNDQHHCGGTLLTEGTILTAAHCYKDPDAEYTVEYGRHNLELEPAEEVGVQVRGVDKVTPHPEFQPTGRPGYDIAVWKLTQPFDAGQSTKVGKGDGQTFVRLDDGGGNYTAGKGKRAKTVGWGWAVSGGPFSDVLMQVDLPIANNQDQCRVVWQGLGRGVNTTLQVCAGGVGGKDVCVGDSGGPLFAADTKNQLPVLVGLTSFGLPCAHEGVPSVFTRVAPFRSWILENI